MTLLDRMKENGARVSEDGSLAECERVCMSTCRSGTSRQGVGKPEWVPINDPVVCLNLPEIQLGLNTPKAGCAYMTDNQQRKDIKSTKGMEAIITLRPDGYRCSEGSISTDSHFF